MSSGSDIGKLDDLRPYQLDGVQFLMSSRSALLSDEMGLGKTVQVAVALKSLARHHKGEQTLVVCLNSLKMNWATELRKWAPGLSVRNLVGSARDRKALYQLPVDVLIASYDQIRADIDWLVDHSKFEIVVLDEAQAIKNATSAISQACRALPRQKGWALTGTPLENSPNDLVSISRFFAPGLLKKGMTISELQTAMQPHFIRRVRKDVFTQLPEVIDQTVIMELTESQRKRYQEVQDVFRMQSTDLESTTQATLFAQITKLKQVCNFDPVTDESCKAEALESIIDNLEQDGKKILLFSQYVETLRWLSERFRHREMPHVLYHGGLDEDVRYRLVTEFNESEGPRMLLISLRAGGAGLNLGSADSVVLFDRGWNPAVEEQAIARAIRFQREKGLHVFRFLVADSIEERINELLAEKQALFEEYVESAETANLGRLNRQDLIALLQG